MTVSKIRKFAQLALALQSAVLPGLAAPDASSLPVNVVDTGYARYRGNLSFPNTVAYLGIPYAEPPLGERRFRAPLPLNTQRVAAAAGGQIVDATQYPDFCIQGSIGEGDAGGAGSEDCLKVNIYAPAGAGSGSKLPVLVYIHGGGYVFGNPANWPFDSWVHQSPNVVIVSVYYRLDAFGFLSTPELADPALGDFNVGFRDQTQALEWVRAHIGSFGGDPGAVTINGESAGGSSVELHLTANVGRDLFRAAIAQSVFRTPLALPEQCVPQFQMFAAKAGCGTGSVEAQLDCLRTASVSALAMAQDFVSGQPTGYRQFHPVVDGTIFTDFPTRQIVNGDFADVPVIVGSTTNETLSGGSSITAALESFFPSMTNDSLAALIAEYPVSEFSDSTALQFQAATGEPELLCARHVIATAASKRTKAWTYRYNQPNPTSGGTAVAHAAENWMMFLGSNTGTNGTGAFSPMTPTETAFASELIAYWLSFVRVLDPNTHKLARSPAWAQFTSANKERMVLQQGPGDSTTVSGSFLETQSEGETTRCEFVAGQVGLQQN
ncbi:alpha/beta-hydrolase [Mycena pura]|uniref:Carboxylic ester hydrolase n=1 Tax=Mycena pura TaxID=153505 RepID=A0AAD6Y7I6_9AGAR|nr:alpha/beta-hydrolase [Mycena pura]